MPWRNITFNQMCEKAKKAKYAILRIMIIDQLLQQPKLEEHMATASMTSQYIARTNLFKGTYTSADQEVPKGCFWLYIENLGRIFHPFWNRTFELVFWNCKGGTEKALLLEVEEIGAQKNKPCVSVIPSVSFEPILYRLFGSSSKTKRDIVMNHKRWKPRYT